MNIWIKGRWAALVSLALMTAATCCGAAEQQEKKTSIPWYFIAIHNEPFNHEQNRFFTEESYRILTKMIAKADECDIKLTLMFAPQWADYLLADKERAAALARWKESGHEIAAHHHSVGHGNWDGYSALPKSEAEAARAKAGGHDFQACFGAETYYGTLTDLTAKLRRLNPAVKSGCMNDEGRKNALPDAIIYDTCSGFANYGQPGLFEPDMEASKGRNDYVSVGMYNGIERRWLTHHFMKEAQAAENAFSSMRSGVYGTVNHSSPHELQDFIAYLDFLHQVDPQGKKSRTVSEVIEQKLLPEKRLTDAQVNTLPPPPPPRPAVPPGGCPPIGPQEKR
jgi:hypothetical protein